MVIWIPFWTVPVLTQTRHLPYPAARNPLMRGVVKIHKAPKKHRVQKICIYKVPKMHPVPKKQLQVPKTNAQVSSVPE